MRFLWLSAVKDLRRRLRDLPALALWLAIPLLMLVLFSVVFGGGGETKAPQVHLLVVDEDKSFAGNMLTGMLSQGELAELFFVEPVAREEGERLIADGKASALLVIPEGFTEAILDRRETTLTLKKNPAQTILPKIAEEVFSVTVDGVFYLQQVLAEPLDTLVDAGSDGPPSDQVVANISVVINQLVTRVEKYIFPPVLSLAEDKPDVVEETTVTKSKS